MTFENVSLPDNAFVGLDIYSPAGAAKFLNVAQLCPESLVLYSKSHSTAIFISKPTNVSDSYKGVKLHYRRVPEGMSNSDFDVVSLVFFSDNDNYDLVVDCSEKIHFASVLVMFCMQ